MNALIDLDQGLANVDEVADNQAKQKDDGYVQSGTSKEDWDKIDDVIQAKYEMV